jgi:glycosyltransferase involved in cell wall biosynthesis
MVLPLLQSTAVNSVLEALACGVPVITTQGGVSDYLDQSCAVQCAPGDAQGIAEATLSLLHDERRRHFMRIAARQRGLQFDWKEVARQMLSIYSAI